ncbi:MAG: hypothetical protein HYY14_02165 [Candidatus Omnitrophica bacterium]|nr:hypothetical protein [Candidatus Omnitrophota bacterium]
MLKDLIWVFVLLVAMAVLLVIVSSAGAEEQGTALNRAPQAVDDEVNARPGQAITIDVLANDSDPDGDPIGIVSFDLPRHGTLSQYELPVPHTGGGLPLGGGRGRTVFEYRPEDGFYGVDNFTYTLTDRLLVVEGADEGLTARATVTIRVPVPFHVEETVPLDGSAPARRFPSRFFGHNLRAVDGAYVWDAERGAPNKAIEVESLEISLPEAIRGARSSLIRFPGGNKSARFFWLDSVDFSEERDARPFGITVWYDPRYPRESVQPPNNINYFPLHFGTDEFLRLVERWGAAAVMQLNWSWGTPQEHAAWVAYCNGRTNDNRMIGWDTPGKYVELNRPLRDWKTVGYWARLRAKNGRFTPYGVKFWGLGNEQYLHQSARPVGDTTLPWWELTARKQGRLTVDDYAQEVVKTAGLMKWVDPNIHVLATAFPDRRNWEGNPGEWFTVGDVDVVRGTGLSWNEHLIKVAGNAVDALAPHFYIGLGPESALRYLEEKVTHIRSAFTDTQVYEPRELLFAENLEGRGAVPWMEMGTSVAAGADVPAHAHPFIPSSASSQYHKSSGCEISRQDADLATLIIHTFPHARGLKGKTVRVRAKVHVSDVKSREEAVRAGAHVTLAYKADGRWTYSGYKRTPQDGTGLRAQAVYFTVSVPSHATWAILTVGVKNAVGAIKVDEVRVESDGKLIFEDMFEDAALPGWERRVNGGKIRVQATDGNSRALKVGPDAHISIPLDGTAVSGRRVRLSGELYTRFQDRPGDSARGRAVFKVTWRDAGGALQEADLDEAYGDERGWIEKELDVDIPAGADHVAWRLGLEGAEGEVFFDNLRVEGVELVPFKKQIDLHVTEYNTHLKDVEDLDGDGRTDEPSLRLTYLRSALKVAEMIFTFAKAGVASAENWNLLNFSEGARPYSSLYVEAEGDDGERSVTVYPKYYVLRAFAEAGLEGGQIVDVVLPETVRLSSLAVVHTDQSTLSIFVVNPDPLMSYPLELRLPDPAWRLDNVKVVTGPDLDSAEAEELIPNPSQALVFPPKSLTRLTFTR